MPRPNPTQVVAGFENLPADTYEFVIGQNVSCKIKDKVMEDGTNRQSEGILYSLRVADGPLKDKNVPLNLPLGQIGNLSEVDAMRICKQFLMAAMGFKNNKDGDEAYNAAHTDEAGWDLNFEDGHVGQYWSEVSGRRIRAEVGVKVKGGYENNTFKWFPVE